MQALADPLNHRTSYSCNEIGNLLSQTDANNHTTRFEYDRLDRRVKRILPLGMEETFAYDAVGNLIAHTDFTGQTTTFAYDPVANTVTTRFPDGTQTVETSTPAGQRESVTDTRGTTRYAYNTLGQLLSQTNPDGSQLSYTYDAAGNRRSVTIPSGTVKYDYDLLDRLTEVKTPDGGSTRYEYDAVGNRAGIHHPNGVSTEYTYNTLNRLTDLVHRDAGGTILGSSHYTLGAAGHRLKVEEYSGRSVAYTYDDTYKLLSETITADPLHGGTTQVISYSYDPVGNRLTQHINGAVIQYQYDANDRLLNAGDISYTYDHNGNTLTKTSPMEHVTYTYNARNQVIHALTQGPSGSETVEYVYDAAGIRVQKRLNETEVVNYLVDHNRPYAQVLEERTGTGALLASYVYGDDLISQTRNGNSNYYLYDGLGSTRALTDPSGRVTDTYIYDAFGNQLDNTGSTVNTHLYTGEFFDSHTGFYYLRARYMDPSIGRFSTMDTFEGERFEPATLHKYMYAGSNPVSYIDPSGYAFTVNELLTANKIEGVLMKSIRVADTIFDVYDKAQTVWNFLTTAEKIFKLTNALTNPSVNGVKAAVISEVQQAIGTTSVADLVGALDDVFQRLKTDWKDISKAMIAKVPEIAANVMRDPKHNIKTYKDLISKGKTRLVIYLPSLPFGKARPINYKRVNKNYEVALSPGGGRLFGFGIRTSNTQAHQAFRIDYWANPGVLATARVGNPFIHYHIYNSKTHYPIWHP